MTAVHVFYKTLKWPKLVEEYHDAAPALDIHNHLCQDGLALESAWGIHKWYHRVYASLLGIIETNAYVYLAHNYFQSQIQETSHVDFIRARVSWSTREFMTTSSVSAEHIPDESFTVARAAGPLMVQSISMAKRELQKIINLLLFPTWRERCTCREHAYIASQHFARPAITANPAAQSSFSVGPLQVASAFSIMFKDAWSRLTYISTSH